MILDKLQIFGINTILRVFLCYVQMLLIQLQLKEMMMIWI